MDTINGWDIGEIRALVWWRINSSLTRKIRAEEVGGFLEVVQEVYLGLLKSPPGPYCRMSTAVANQTDWSMHRMKRVNRHLWDLASIEEPLDSRDFIEELELQEREGCWDVVKKVLKPREFLILTRMISGDIGAELALELGISRQRVYQIREAAIKRLQSDLDLRDRLLEYF